MIKALSLAAALAVLPLSAAAAADPQEAEVSEAATAAEAAIEAAAERFEARMEEFGERAEALGADESLTEDQREIRIAALWGDYAPDVQSFTAALIFRFGPRSPIPHTIPGGSPARRVSPDPGPNVSRSFPFGVRISASLGSRHLSSWTSGRLANDAS